MNILILNILGRELVPFANDVRIIKSELKKEIFKYDYYKYFNNNKKLFSLERQLKQVPQSKAEIYIILNKFMKLNNRVNSNILTYVLLKQILKTINLKNLSDVHKYIKPLANSLYKNKICDGYLFKGEYEYSLNNNLDKAISIYKEGLVHCSLEWKRFELQSRLNKYSYIQDKKIGIK
jgi:hypothetical protein